MRRSGRSRMRSDIAARREREQIFRLRRRLLSKKITVRQRLYNLRIVARQAQPEDANGPPKDEGEDLPRRGGRGRQDLPNPTIHPRSVRRPIHLDARREGLEERDQIGRAERSEERRVGKEGRATRWPRDWSSDVCSSDLEDCGASGPTRGCKWTAKR